jgi:hypothetical protein
MSFAEKSMVDYELWPKLKGAQVWDFDVLDFYDFFIMKSI